MVRQLEYTICISNNRASFHWRWKENLIKHQKSQNVKIIADIEIPHSTPVTLAHFFFNNTKNIGLLHSPRSFIEIVHVLLLCFVGVFGVLECFITWIKKSVNYDFMQRIWDSKILHLGSTGRSCVRTSANLLLKAAGFLVCMTF